MTWRLFLVIIMLISKAAFACNAVDDKVILSLESDIKSSDSTMKISSGIDFGYLPPVCKGWSQKTGLRVVVRPYAYKQTDGDDERYLGMAVAVIDEKNGVIRGKVEEKKMMVVDAIEPSEISIDTANYLVSHGEVAFGIRTTRRNQSSVAPFSEESMNMYLLETGNLRKIADALLVASYNGEGGGGCSFSGTQRLGTISVSINQSNGYFDLIEKMKTSSIQFSGTAERCEKSETKVSTRSYILKYDGSAYQIPEALRAVQD